MERPASRTARTAQIIIGLLLTLGCASLPISAWEDEFAGVGHLVGYEVIWWALVALVLLYVRFVEGRPLESIGFRRLDLKGGLLAIAGAVVMLAGLAGIYYLVFPALHLNEEPQLNQLINTPFWWRVISVVRAAVAEEILFRGYPIERIRELTGSLTVAAVVSCAIFALAHVGAWGWSHLLLAGFGGVILTVLYLWRRNLWVNMITHFIVDGTAILLG